MLLAVMLAYPCRLCPDFDCRVMLLQVSTAVCVFVFDLLYYGGQTLLGRSLRERLSLLPKALPHMRPGYIEPATHVEIKMTAQALATAATPGNIEKKANNTANASKPSTGNSGKMGVSPLAEGNDNKEADDEVVIDEDEEGGSRAEAGQDDVTVVELQEAELQVQRDQEMQLDNDETCDEGDNNGQGLLWSLFEPVSHVAAEKLLIDLMLQASEAGTEGGSGNAPVISKCFCKVLNFKVLQRRVPRQDDAAF